LGNSKAGVPSLFLYAPVFEFSRFFKPAEKGFLAYNKNLVTCQRLIAAELDFVYD